MGKNKNKQGLNKLPNSNEKSMHVGKKERSQWDQKSIQKDSDDVSLVIYPHGTNVYVTSLDNPLIELPVLITDQNCKLDSFNKKYYKIPAFLGQVFLIEIMSTKNTEVKGVKLNGDIFNIHSIMPPSYLRINREIRLDDKTEMMSYFLRIDATKELSILSSPYVEFEENMEDKNETKQDTHVDSNDIKNVVSTDPTIMGHRLRDFYEGKNVLGTNKSIIFNSNKYAKVSLCGKEFIYLNEETSCEAVVSMNKVDIVIGIKIYDELKDIKLNGIPITTSVWCEEYKKVSYQELSDDYFKNSSLFNTFNINENRFDTKWYYMVLNLNAFINNIEVATKFELSLIIDPYENPESIKSIFIYDNPEFYNFSLSRESISDHGKYCSLNGVNGLDISMYAKSNETVSIRFDGDENLLPIQISLSSSDHPDVLLHLMNFNKLTKIGTFTMPPYDVNLKINNTKDLTKKELLSDKTLDENEQNDTSKINEEKEQEKMSYLTIATSILENVKKISLESIEGKELESRAITPVNAVPPGITVNIYFNDNIKLFGANISFMEQKDVNSEISKEQFTSYNIISEHILTFHMPVHDIMLDKITLIDQTKDNADPKFIGTFKIPDDLAKELSDSLIKQSIRQKTLTELVGDPDKYDIAEKMLIPIVERIDAIKNIITEQHVPMEYRSNEYQWSYDGYEINKNNVNIYRV